MNNKITMDDIKTYAQLNGGLAASTLVHTKHGLVPIEQLQVGDQVLSKAADGSGELVYKPISKTMITENVPIFLLEFNHYINPELSVVDRINLRVELDDKALPSPLLVSANHPFWTSSKGWVTAAQLSTQDPMLTHDGKQFVSKRGGGFDYKYQGIVPLMKTNQENFGYIVKYGDDTGTLGGMFVDLTNGKRESASRIYKPIVDKLWINYDGLKEHLLEQTPRELRENMEFYGFRQGHWRDPDTVQWGAGEGPLTMTVYNIEVEDTHTYFVGEAGIWVHNCGGEATDPVNNSV